MNIVSSLILLFTIVISIIPVIKMNATKDDYKYRCLKFLVNTAFLWTLITLSEKLITNMSIVYYLHMISYPIKFFVASFMVCTIINYTNKKVPKILIHLFILGMSMKYLRLYTIDLVL